MKIPTALSRLSSLQVLAGFLFVLEVHLGDLGRI